MHYTPLMCTVRARKEQSLGQFSEDTAILMIYTCILRKRSVDVGVLFPLLNLLKSGGYNRHQNALTHCVCTAVSA